MSKETSSGSAPASSKAARARCSRRASSTSAKRRSSKPTRGFLPPDCPFAHINRAVGVVMPEGGCNRSRHDRQFRLTARANDIFPILGFVAAMASLAMPLNSWAVAFILAGAVVAAVHHAEVIAHRVGEPFGTLILALAVTVIEVGLIQIGRAHV